MHITFWIISSVDACAKFIEDTDLEYHAHFPRLHGKETSNYLASRRLLLDEETRTSLDYAVAKTILQAEMQATSLYLAISGPTHWPTALPSYPTNRRNTYSLSTSGFRSTPTPRSWPLPPGSGGDRLSKHLSSPLATTTSPASRRMMSPAGLTGWRRMGAGTRPSGTCTSPRPRRSSDG